MLASVAIAPGTARAADPTLSCAPSCAVAGGTSVTFTASVPAGVLVVEYAWDLDGDGVYGRDDGEPFGATVTQTARAFPDAGRFVVAVRARDATGAIGFARTVVTVSAPPPPPPSPPPAEPPTTAPPVGTAPPAAAPPEAALPIPGAPPPPPPLAGADGDADGAGDEDDLCPGTARGAGARLRGCSLADVASDSGRRLTDAAAQELDDALSDLRRRLGGTAPADGSLRAGVVALRRSSKTPCAASRTAARGQATARSALAALDDTVGSAGRGIAAEASRALRRGALVPGDASGYDVRHAVLVEAHGEVRDAFAAVAAVAGALKAVCAADEGPVIKPGRLIAIEGVTMRLDDGTVLVPAVTHRFEGPVVGARVRVRGRKLAGKTIIVSQLDSVDLGKAATKLPCTITPRLAPVQGFGSPNDTLWEDHRAFRDDGDVYRLERGMGVGVTRDSTCKGDEYAIQVILDAKQGSVTLGTELGWLRGLGVEAALIIPETYKAKNVRLRFKVYELACDFPKDIQICGDATLIAEPSFKTRIEPLGGYGALKYDHTTYSVEDGSSTDYDIGTITGIDAPTLPAITAFGYGYPIQADGTSSYPSRGYVLRGEKFAVHDDVPSAAEHRAFFRAHLQGFRNGYVYHYVARQPEIVTDRLTTCGSGYSSFYRLPWKDNSLALVTQGNNSEPTHSGGQKYAFDFRMHLLDFGYATRGGKVKLVVENRVKNVKPATVKLGKQLGLDLWIPGNVLIIEHQDGTSSFYTHMMPAGVFPAEGDIVERGERVIVIGQTGNASGPHLHYHVTSDNTNEDTATGNTVPIRFEARNPLSPQPLTCLLPAKGSAYFSSNARH